MKTKTVLIGVLIVLAGVFAAIKLGTGRRGGEKPLFRNFIPEESARLAVNAKDTHAVLRKVNDVWFAVSEDSLPAEPGVVQDLLETVSGFSRKDMISSNPAKYSLYQVDSTGVRVTISDAQGDTLVRFVAGKPGPDYQSTYVRDVASGDVVLAPGYLRPMFDRGPRSWQDRTIFAYQPDDIVAIDLHRPEGDVALRLDQAGLWTIVAPESVACDQDRAGRVVRTLAYLRCDDFGGRMPLPASGLSEPDSSVGFRTADGIREVLVLGNLREDGRVFAKRADSDIIYLLAAPKVNVMLPRPAELQAGQAEVPKGAPGGEGS